jgi:hypothetical protein
MLVRRLIGAQTRYLFEHGAWAIRPLLSTSRAASETNFYAIAGADALIAANIQVPQQPPLPPPPLPSNMWPRLHGARREGALETWNAVCNGLANNDINMLARARFDAIVACVPEASKQANACNDNTSRLAR